MAFVLGIDVSAYNKPTDWESVRKEGVKFTFIKASENTFPDTGFVQNWQKAKDAGILRGAYHFFRPEAGNAVQQADAFIRSVGADRGELPPVLDLETVYDRQRNSLLIPVGLPERVKTWLDRVEAAFGRKPIIYTRAEFIRFHQFKASWTADYPLWLAQYPLVLRPNNKWKQISDPHVDPVPRVKMPEQPVNWQAWKFWQYSELGNMKGFLSTDHVDLNYFNGTLEELYQFASLSTPEPIRYSVQAGDTLPVIANKYDVSLEELVNLNNASLIQLGKQLIIPGHFIQPVPPPPAGTSGTASKPVPSSKPTVTYIVQPGDTLGGIASRFRTTVQEIMSLNTQIKNPDLIASGDTLIIAKG